MNGSVPSGEQIHLSVVATSCNDDHGGSLTRRIGQTLDITGKRIGVLLAVHTVPAVRYAVTAGKGCWVFTGDTERNPAFWRRINQMNVAALVIETAFSNREKDLARRSLHLSPHALADELDCIDKGKSFPIFKRQFLFLIHYPSTPCRS